VYKLAKSIQSDINIKVMRTISTIGKEYSIQLYCKNLVVTLGWLVVFTRYASILHNQ